MFDVALSCLVKRHGRCSDRGWCPVRLLLSVVHQRLVPELLQFLRCFTVLGFLRRASLYYTFPHSRVGRINGEFHLMFATVNLVTCTSINTSHYIVQQDVTVPDFSCVVCSDRISHTDNAESWSINSRRCDENSLSRDDDEDKSAMAISILRLQHLFFCAHHCGEKYILGENCHRTQSQATSWTISFCCQKK